VSARAGHSIFFFNADTNTFSLHSSRNDHSVVGQMLIPMPYPLEDREWVGITRWEQMKNGNYVIVQDTTMHPEFPPADGVVQVDLTRVFTVRQAGPRCSSVVCVAHMDMGGSIPNWINTRITVPTMKSTPISIQQYVREGSCRCCKCPLTSLAQVLRVRPPCRRLRRGRRGGARPHPVLPAVEA
jgi:hypothetical protein